MTKAEEYVAAWRLGYRGDFSLVDRIYHPDYKSFDYRTGIEANLEDDKVITSTLNAVMTIGHFQTIYESEDFLCVECFVKQNYAEIDGSDPDYAARITAVHYENGKIIAQKTSTNPLDFDPSEYFEWNWEDYD
ncbi:MAG: hypothetical protein VXZ27_11100 [SAR324 cluster bacterium]|nr:hypothetical protein [SAR324 cluster bacterium]MEC8436352.1 hypothetical protein [SAR324 cluster bacterium]